MLFALLLQLLEVASQRQGEEDRRVLASLTIDL